MLALQTKSLAETAKMQTVTSTLLDEADTCPSSILTDQEFREFNDGSQMKKQNACPHKQNLLCKPLAAEQVRVRTN
jgi:hypothetical protein